MCRVMTRIIINSPDIIYIVINVFIKLFWFIQWSISVLFTTEHIQFEKLECFIFEKWILNGCGWLIACKQNSETRLERKKLTNDVENLN